MKNYANWNKLWFNMRIQLNKWKKETYKRQSVKTNKVVLRRLSSLLIMIIVWVIILKLECTSTLSQQKITTNSTLSASSNLDSTRKSHQNGSTTLVLLSLNGLALILLKAQVRKNSVLSVVFLTWNFMICLLVPSVQIALLLRDTIKDVKFSKNSNFQPL